jgi:two-component system, LuxR family, response regulator FixJ
MIPAKQTVYVVEDDNSSRALICALSQSLGLPCRSFAAAGEFLAQYAPLEAGCLVLDMLLPDMDGLALQQELTLRGATIPIIFITGHSDVHSAVEAMRRGAFNFLQKPLSNSELTDNIRRALDLDRYHRATRHRYEAIRQRLDSLTPREREVLDRIARGRPNKLIAVDLKLSERSIELHRSHLMEKMGVTSVAQLVRMLVSVEGGVGGNGAGPGPGTLIGPE